MTILERINLGENMYSSKHEAPFHLITSEQKQRWIETGKPCFNNEILQLWKIYGEFGQLEKAEEMMKIMDELKKNKN